MIALNVAHLLRQYFLIDDPLRFEVRDGRSDL